MNTRRASVLLLGSWLLLLPLVALAKGPAAEDEKSAPLSHELRASMEHAARQGSVLPKAPPPKPAPAAEQKPRLDADQVWRELLEGNARFVAGNPRPRELIETRKALSSGQSPKAIVLACSDSRVGPELLFDQSLGDLFVVRTAGNVADQVALASIEYAVEHLHVGLLVVLGHESCGAVKAATEGGKMPTANLAALMKKITPALESLRTCPVDQGPLARVEANVHHSAKDVILGSPIVREHLERGDLKVVKGVYHLASGEIDTL